MMNDIKTQIDKLVSEYKAELTAEIINKYLNHVVVDLDKFKLLAFSKASHLRSTWSGGHSVSNLIEQAEAEVWIELGHNAEFYL